MQCFFPAWLDASLDSANACKARGDVNLVGVHLVARSWRIDVSAEAQLLAGRPFVKDQLEFFRVLLRVASEARVALIC